MRARPGRPARFEPAQPTPLDPGPVRQRAGVPPPPHAVWVGSGSKWAGRPVNGRWAAAVVEYSVWIAGRADLLAAARAELAGYDLVCECPLEMPCHRDVLLDIANPPADPYAAGGRAIGLTVRRPWASMLLMPLAAGGTGIHASSWSTDYRGPVCIYGGSRIVDSGVAAARATGLDADWHVKQRGWLGAAVLADVHRAGPRCCHTRWADHRLYHWVFRSPGRLALPAFGRGFIGLRPLSWSVLQRRTRMDLRPVGVIGDTLQPCE